MRTTDAPKSMTGTFMHVLRTNGPLGLYNGISASLLRQATYSTVRFGVYEELKARASSATGAAATTLPRLDGTPSRAQQPPFAALIAIAAVSGFLGGVSGNAADVLNVRMQHDAALPAAQRRNYHNAIDGWIRMTREEGLGSWFRGWWPNSVRAAFIASQLAIYDVAKNLLVERVGMRSDALSTHFAASFTAGVVAATVTNPVDVVKTKVMSATGKSGVIGVVKDLNATEGVWWVVRGWAPSFLRIGP